MPASTNIGVPGLRWLGHAVVLLEGPPVVYVDPWRLREHDDLPPADLVLITHGHFDHASLEDVEWVAGEDVVVAGPSDALEGLPGRHVALEAGSDETLCGVRVRAFASGDSEDGFHPPSRCLGYLVEGAGLSLLHVGDTTNPPPVFEPAPDVAAVPICGGMLPDPERAAELALGTGAERVLPIHWGDLQGHVSDARRFRDAVKSTSPSTAVILRDIPERTR
ncbi:MAG: MBL fold metallo-hydrolase [Planctomycetota bacterium]